jgi:hypothetical protein
VKLSETLLFCATVSLAGCGDSTDAGPDDLGPVRRHPVPGCEQFDPAPCDILESGCQKNLFGIAACLRGNEPSDLPSISILTEPEFEAYLRASLDETEPSPNLEHTEKAFVMLGLVTPGAFSDEALIADLVQQIGGFYAWDDDSIVIIDHGEATDPQASSAVLVHELVHALQDREVDLRDYYEQHAATRDSSWAADAVTEGEADFHEQHYLASMLGFDPADVDFDRLFANGASSGEERALELASPLAAGEFVFPYAFGARYVHHGWQASGHAGVLDLFASPPPTTHQLMQSVSSVLVDDFTPSTFASPAAPAEQWTEIGADSIGAFGTFLTLGRLADLEAARRSALSWRGDRLTFYAGTPTAARDPRTTAVVWSVDFADAAVADSVALVLRGLGSPRAPARADGVRVTFAATDDGTLPEWAFPPAP